jgi:hypothetical protein
MKKLAITLLCLTPIVAFAQNPMGMNQEDMQKMMQQMQKAQTCMKKIDQSEMKVLEKKQKQFKEEVKSLCAGGKRGAAQAKAMSFAKEMANSALIKALKKCGEMMKGMTQEMPFMSQDEDYSNQHVCDPGI